MEDLLKKTIILASASPRRKDLLEQIGLRPEIEPSHVIELISSTKPDLVVMELSEQKAADIAKQHRGRPVVVIGADTVVAVDDQILGKPVDEADAVRMISLIQGRIHQVYTGVTLVDCEKGTKRTFTEQTDVSVYPMTDAEIHAYASTGEPLDKAGAYGIQGFFAAYIKAVHGDYSNVVGLPVGRVYQELKTLI